FRRARLSLTTTASLGTLRAILGTAAAPSINPERIERPADDMIAHTRQILHSATADQHDRVFLEIVTLARNVGYHFLAIRQPPFRHFAQGRVRLLRRPRHYLNADSAPLRTIG